MSLPPPTNPTPPPSPNPSPQDRSQQDRSQQDRSQQDRSQSGTDGSNLPVLRRTIVRPTRVAPDPIDSAYIANRLTTLTHDLANLLDGSLRVIGLAQRSIHRRESTDCTSGSSSAEPLPIEQLTHQLSTLHAAMAQMAELVRASMLGLSNGAEGSKSFGVRPPFGVTSTLTEAIEHAVDVMRPIAEDRCIRVETRLSRELDSLEAGPIYTVVANGVRNAIEAIERRGTPIGGCVLIRAWLEAGRTGRAILIEISDDGIGLSPATSASDTPFRVGFSTKPEGSGLGLAISKDVVQQLGGTIQLRSKEPGNAGANGATGAPAGTGAVLRVCYPCPRSINQGPGEGLAQAG